jgi:hypothetical protein
VLEEVEDLRETKILPQSAELEEDPSAGDPIPGWNKEGCKVRIASSDVKKGKRGGYPIGLSTSGGAAGQKARLA